MKRPARALAVVASIATLAFAHHADAEFLQTRVASFATTSNTFVDVPEGFLTFAPTSPTDVWVVLVSARLRSSTNVQAGTEAQYTINATARGMGGVQDYVPASGASWLHFDRVTGTTAKQTVQVQLRHSMGDTATIEDLKIVAFRVPSGADFQFSETMGTRLTPASVWTAQETLSFTPSSAGTYLVLATINGHEAPSSSAVGVRLQDPLGNFWPIDSNLGVDRLGHFENGRGSWYSFFLARAQALDTTPKTFLLQAQGAVPSGADVRDSRMMAFRVDAFDGFESSENVAESSISSTTPVVTASVTTAPPPASRDYIVIQSLSMNNAGSTTDAKQAGFESDDVVRTSYSHVINSPENWVSYGSFDAVTTSRSVKYENTVATSNAATPVATKESVIHVLRLSTSSCVCAPLASTETTNKLTVTSPGSFELVFDGATGGGVRELYDLATDPGRTADLAGSEPSGIKALHHSGVLSSGLWYSTDDNTSDTASPNFAGSPPRIELLEATPTRTRLRQRTRYQQSGGSAILGGVAGTGDYSLYPSGRLAYRWNLSTTTAVPFTDRDLQISSRVESSCPPNATGLCANLDAYQDTGVLPPAPGPPWGTLDTDYLLAVRELGVVRNDFLHIAYRDWAAADRSELDPTIAFLTWRDLTAGNLPTSESWDFLTYFKDQNLVSYGDPDVTGRRDDYRTPDPLSFALGSGWNENTADADFFNESEGAYTLNFDMINGLRFDMNGSTTVRYRPFFKIRRWRSFQDPTVTLEGASLTNDVHFRADVKPVSRASLGKLLWYSTLENTAALSVPNVGSPGGNTGATFVAGLYGGGVQVTSGNKYVEFPTTDFDKAKGAIELWFQPTFGSNDGAEHNLMGFRANPTNEWFLQKGATNNLSFIITANSVTSTLVVAPGQFSWRATEWVHLRIEWDDSLPLATQQRLFVNGVEPVHTDPTIDYNSTNLTLAATYEIGAYRSGAANAPGIYDEIYVWGGSTGAPTSLAHSGLTAAADEYLASTVNDATLSFQTVDATGRGEYLYLGSDSKIGGINVDLDVGGTGTADLQWQYWNGTGWASLEIAGFTDETSQLSRDGTIYWPDPPGWTPYSLRGGPDLYYVRAYVATGSYTVSPQENLIKTDVLLFQYCNDVTLAAQTFDFAIPLPTAVRLVSFEAHPGDGVVELTWTTGSEMKNLGFFLYRSASSEGPFERINESLVPGLGSSPEGASYRYLDADVVNGTTYFYELEDVEWTGKTERHGPVTANPRSGLTTDEGPNVTAGGTARMTFGDPEAGGFRVLRREGNVVTLELRTGGFWAESSGDGTVLLSAPGLEGTLPSKRAWVEAPGSPSGAARVESIRVRDVARFSNLRPAEQAIDLEATFSGVVVARRRRGGRSALRSGHTWVQVLQNGFLGEQRAALLELAPFFWNDRGDELVLARRIEVRLRFDGKDGPSDVQSSRRNRESGRVVRRLAVTQAGLQAVSFEEVFGHGGRPVDPKKLRLSRAGETVAYHIDPPGPFRRGTQLFFASEGPELNPYGPEAIYELDLGGQGRTMKTISLSNKSSTTPRLVDVGKSVEREEDRFYQAGLVEANDPWYWAYLLAPSSADFPFQVSALAPGVSGGPNRVEVELQGASDVPDRVDHHVRVYVNRVLVGDDLWDGRSALTLKAELPAGVLREGDNLLSIENVGDAGTGLSMVLVDRFRVDYRGRAVSDDGVLELTVDRDGFVELEGFEGDHAYVVDTTDADPRWVSGVDKGANALLPGEAGRRYLVTREDRVRRPQVRKAHPTRLRASQNGADYLLVAPRSFLPATADLLELRRRQGLRVAAVAIEDVFEEFGFGETTPSAVRAFLSYAYHEWRPPSPRYVVLLGDATYDFKDHLGTGVTNEIPPLMVRTPLLWTVSDPILAAVHGDDELPDLAIGRLPAKSIAEAETMVEKIVAYEEHATFSEGPFVLVADNADRGGDFASSADRVASLFADRDVRKIYLDEMDVERAREAILESFDEGASLVSYLGHGGIHLWANEDLLDIDRAEALTAQEHQPIVLTMNCLNGYFHFPYFDSLAERLVKLDGRGAIAAFSPSGLGFEEPASRLHQAVVEALLKGGHRRLGDALLAAEYDYLEQGSPPELVTTYHLLGDPALVLR